VTDGRTRIEDKIDDLRARLASNVELSSSFHHSRAHLDAGRREIERQLAVQLRLSFEDIRVMADRIQARVVRRMGELLKTFSNERVRTDLDDGAPTRNKAADKAGSSDRQ
jgi:hypothetical protein